jgi:hypothetical protein
MVSGLLCHERVVLIVFITSLLLSRDKTGDTDGEEHEDEHDGADKQGCVSSSYAHRVVRVAWK